MTFRTQPKVGDPVRYYATADAQPLDARIIAVDDADPWGVASLAVVTVDGNTAEVHHVLHGRQRVRTWAYWTWDDEPA